MIFTKESKPTILVVDDSVENLTILNALLKDDYRVKIAKEGTKALELARQCPQPDLILLDIIMPGISGFQVCEELKRCPSTQQIPVIFLTALNEETDETKGLKLGGADFITKPINPEIVRTRINIHLELQVERRKTEALLKIMLPENVISDLINNGVHQPKVLQNVSIMFCDFVGFTAITSQLQPDFLINELTEIYTHFDEICTSHNVVRIKTIGDAYMAATGIHSNDENHAQNIINAALEILEFLNKRNTYSKQEWQCRIGINSGEVIGGIIGKTRFAYDIIGMDVNIAARVEGAGYPMSITITPATKYLVGNQYQIDSIGCVALKGAGEMELFTINSDAAKVPNHQSNKNNVLVNEHETAWT
jgi:adenylate cyclase